MNPATNICKIRNYGSERYECLKTNELIAYIDISRLQNGLWRAYVQIGKEFSGLSCFWEDAKSKTRAVLAAFEQIQAHFEQSDYEDQIACPNILRRHFERKGSRSRQMKLF